MNAISKRLLSWLCVIAMVLSLVPAMSLAGFAVETQAAEEIVYGTANYEGVDAAILEQMNKGNAIDNSDEAFAAHLANNTCPVCGSIEGWEKLSYAEGKTYVTSKYYGKEEHTGMKLHYYYDDAVTTANGNMIGFAEKAKGNTACIWVKSTQNIINNKERVAMVANDNVVNFFGEGTVTTLTDEGANNNNMFQCAGGVLNLYGGTFVYNHPQTDFRKAAIRVAGASAVINIYDGVKIGPATVDNTKVTQNVQYSHGGTVNMFGGEIRNGVSPAWGYSGNVTIAANGTFNMYAGTITGGTYLDAAAVTSGVTMNATLGGNVMVGGKNQETFYVEEKENFEVTSGTFNMYGGTIADGKANNGGNGGGNVYVAQGKSVMNMQGGTISGGYAKAVAGNLQVGAGTATISGTALITGGQAKTNGGNIFVRNSSAILNVSGGKIADGTAPNGGNIYIAASGANTISGGIISGGLATTNGGNLYVLEPCLTITGGTFENGIANNQGGNISTAADLAIANATIIGGIGRKGGGNINVSSQEKTLTLTDCTVANGWVSGAIDEEGNLTAPNGAQWGGNIRTWCGTVIIDGGLYYGGIRGTDKKNVNAGNNIAVLSSVEKSATKSLAGAFLTIKGDAVVVGDINTSAPTADATGAFTSPGTAVTLEGAPTITNKYTLADGTKVGAVYGGLNVAKNSVGSVKIDISGLTADASVMFTAYMDQVLTLPADNAAALVEAGCFSLSNSKHMVAANDSKELYVTEKVIEFVPPVKPEATLGGQNVSDEVWAEVVKAAEIQVNALNLDPTTATTCPACGAADITWTEVNGKISEIKEDNSVSHYYIDAETKITQQYNWATLHNANQTLCILLKNGETAKEIGGMIAARGTAKNGTINIMGDGIITSKGNYIGDAQFGTVCLQGTDNTLNLYGGTFIYTGDGQGRKYLGDLNENGKKESSEYAPNGASGVAAAVCVKSGTGHTVNVFNETTIGPDSQDLTAPRFNVQVSGASTFNMYGGTIQNGVSDQGNSSNAVKNVAGNVTMIGKGGTFNMYGGEIKNGMFATGETQSLGANIASQDTTTVNISGGTITGGETISYGGSIFLTTGSVLTISGGTITGGTSARGGNIAVRSGTINISDYAKICNGTATDDGGGNVYMYTGGTLNMTGGVVCDGNATKTNGGNILAQGGSSYNKETQVTTFSSEAVLNLSGNAEIYGGTAANQAGNVRVYIGSVTMSGNVKIHSGDGVKGVDDLWLVDAALVMEGNAAVESKDTENENAVGVTVYRRSNSVTLKDNATVTGSYNALSIGKNLHNGDKVTQLYTHLQIDNSWTGTANVTFTDSYGPKATLLAEDAICGTEVGGVFTKGGTFAGKLYYGSLAYCPITGVEGDLVLAGNGVAKADDTGAWFDTAAEALAAYEHGVDKYVVLSEDATIDGDVIIDLAGQNLTISGKGKIYGMDSANKKFEKFGKITIAEGAEIEYAAHTYHPENGYRYVALLNGNELSFHYLTISIDTVTLQTEGAGVYYKSKFKCDETLAAAIDGYGMVLSLTDMPVADFMTEDDLNLTTLVDGPLVLDETGTCVAASGAVTGILKADRTAAENQQIAEMKIYSNAYVKVGEDIILYKGGNPYVEFDAEEDSVAYSLKDILVAADDGFTSYGDADKQTLKAFYETWKDLGISAWASELENIIAYQPAAEA